MKNRAGNFALIFGFIATLLSNEHINAMPSAEQTADRQNRIPIALYTVRLEPPVEVLVIPSKEKVKLGGFIAPEINIDCKRFNGFPIYSPIHVRYDMSLNDIVDSLCESFHVEGIECREGSLSQEAFASIFPSLSRNL